MLITAEPSRSLLSIYSFKPRSGNTRQRTLEKTFRRQCDTLPSSVPEVNAIPMSAFSASLNLKSRKSSKRKVTSQRGHLHTGSDRHRSRNPRLQLRDGNPNTTSLSPPALMLARYHTVRQYHLGMKPPLPLHLARRQRAGGKASSHRNHTDRQPGHRHTDRCSGSRSVQNGKVLDRAGFRPFAVTVGRYGGTC